MVLVKEREASIKNVGWLAVNSKGSELAVCANADVCVLNAKTLAVVKTYRSTGRRAEFVLGDRCLVVSGVLRTGIELLDRTSGESKLLNYGEPDFQCHAGRDLLAYRAPGDEGPTLVVYDLKNRKVLKRWDPKTWVGSPGLRCFSAKGVLFGDCLKTMRNEGRTTFTDSLLLWSPPFDREPRLIAWGKDPRCLAVDPQGKRLAVGTDAGAVEIWDLAAAGKLRTLPQRKPARVSVVAYSPDGKLLAVLSSRNSSRRGAVIDPGDTELIVYRTADLEPVARTMVHRSPSHLLTFFPDGKRLATAGRFDGLVRVWRLK
jgi:WD40 repeat protein